MKTQLDKLVGNKRVWEGVDLFPYLSMRLHTKAQYFFEATSKEDLIQSVRAARRLSLPLILLGGGTNSVFSTSTINGLVVKNSFQSIEYGVESEHHADVEVGSGTNMGVLIQNLIAKGLSGLEYHKGLPGAVGGAIYMNSKWTHPLSYVGDCVYEAVLLDAQGTVKKVSKDYFKFAYDYSVLQDTREVLLSVTFRLLKETSQDVLAQANESFSYRKKTQPQGGATCGCFFQNISREEQIKKELPTQSVGYLIDQCGMKGKRVGSFAVSLVHANFIVNEGGDARPDDLRMLVQEIKDTVKAKFGVELKEEVQII